LIKNVFHVLIDGWHRDIEQLSHQLLCQPDGFILIPGLDALFAALPGKDQKFSRAVADQLLSFVFILFHGSSSYMHYMLSKI